MIRVKRTYDPSTRGAPSTKLRKWFDHRVERWALRQWVVNQRLKRAVADAVIAVIEPMRARYTSPVVDAAFLERVLADGAEHVRPLAQLTLGRLRELMGLCRA